MAQVSELSDEWLSRYGLLENFITRMTIFEVVLNFNLQPHSLNEDAYESYVELVHVLLRLIGLVLPNQKL